MKCSSCAKSTKDATAFKCTVSTCGKCFCSQCVSAPSITTERKKIWKCLDCSASLKKGGDSTITPTRSETENQNLCVITRTKSHSNAVSELKELTDTISQLTAEFSSLKTKLDDVTHSLCHCHERMDELVRSISANETRLINLEKRDHEVDNLKATVQYLQNEINAQSQYNLRNEIEVIGIPEHNGENLNHIIKIAAQKVGVQLEENDVDWVTRTGPRQPPAQSTLTQSGSKMPRPVIVRLLRRHKRDQFLKAAKSRRNLSSTDLEITGSPAKVYFNERLTKANRNLFCETRIRAKNHGFAFCWCNQGSIYIRQREGKPAILIRTHHLDRLLPASPDDNSTQ